MGGEGEGGGEERTWARFEGSEGAFFWSRKVENSFIQIKALYNTMVQEIKVTYL